jgi:Ca2+-binding RTX toxin-like protein
MAGFGAVVELSSLDGTNGFEIDAEAPGDQLGGSVSSAGDVNGDGFDDVIVGAWGARPNGSFSGASYVVFGGPDGFSANLDLGLLDGTNGFQISGSGSAHERIGGAVASAGDVNGDGFADVIIGAPEAGYGDGACYVIFGSADGFPPELNTTDVDGPNGFALLGTSTPIGHALAGGSVASAGDVNGDGVGDLIIGAEGLDPNGAFSGSSYLVFGSAGGFPSTVKLSSLDGSNGFRLDGEAEIDHSGETVSSAGDVNGDGFDDLLIAAPLANNFTGASYVVFGAADGFPAALDLADLDGTNGFEIDSASGEVSGFSVACAGDVNGDGLDDLVIGATIASPYTQPGACYVVFGQSNGFEARLNLSTVDGVNGVKITGYVGEVASAGDVNGDGFDDIIIGCGGYNANGDRSGACYVVFGGAAGFPSDLDLSALDGSNGFRIDGEAQFDYAGISVASAGDVNGDGFDDLVIGATGGGDYTGGASYVVFGVAPDTAVTRIGSDASQTIAGGEFNDSLSALGGDDQLFGNGGADTLDGGAGNDRLDGGAGSDQVAGGSGNDTYIVDSSDTVIEASGGGTDVVESSITYSLAANVEQLTLTGTGKINGTGNGLANTLIGNSSANVLAGLDGNDTLKGGLGSDTLDGGTGTDTADYRDKTTSVAVTLNGANSVTVKIGGAAEDTIKNVENVYGGSAADTLTGDGLANYLYGYSGDDLLKGGAGADKLDGYSGIDTADYRDKTTAVAVTLNGSTYATLTVGGVAEDTLSRIENVYGGSADDTLTGDGSANLFRGGLGADALDGAGGIDTADYGDKTAGVAVTLNGGTKATVTVGGAAEDTLKNIENVAGGSVGDRLTGDGLANVLTGNGGDDALDGRGGADRMEGGSGDDSYVVDNSGDKIVEKSGGGTDAVQSSITLTLTAEVENLTLSGSGNIGGTGNSANNVLTGNNGGNTLNGVAGHDKMVGGDGNDTYVVDSGGDVVQEKSGEGTDLVQASATFTLSANVENLTLTGSSAINGTGNSGANVLTGNGANNVLTGLGGNDTLDGRGGHDKMVGGRGNDAYVVDSSGDVVQERAGGGTDTVQSSATFALSANVENLTLTGSSSINGTGNTLGNVLTGNGGKNKLDGGAGNDKLTGGGSADTFVFHDGDGSDVVTDFDDGADKFDLRGVAGVDDRGDLHLTDTGADVLVDYGSGSFVVEGVSGTSVLDAGDFIFA